VNTHREVGGRMLFVGDRESVDVNETTISAESAQ